MNQPKCDLCGDQPEAGTVLYSNCHYTAPLKARMEGDTLILSCYVPECSREVARFKVTAWEMAKA